MTAACAGTTKKGGRCTMPAARDSDYCYLHDPAVAARRSRNASRAATLGNSKIGVEIRSTRLLVRGIVEMTVAKEVHPLVKKRLTDVVGLLRTYARLAELEINVGERLRTGGVTLPEDTGERIRGWAEGEEATIREREEMLADLVPAMEARGYDTGAVKAVLGT